MEHAGRQSLADFSVVRALPGDRPEPPDCLNDEQKVLWRSVTATKPPEWFTDETLPLLRAYCEADLVHRQVSDRLKRFDTTLLADPEMLGLYATLSRLQTAQAGSMSSLAVKMRLSQSSRYDALKAARSHNRTSQTARKPWEE